MRVIKYFYEEPTLLDLDDQPSEDSGGSSLARLLRQHKHYRGYLAASDLESGQIGGSSLDDNAAAEALSRVLGGPVWFSNRAPGQEEVELRLLSDHEHIVAALATMASNAVMILDFESDQGVDEDVVAELTKDQDRKRGLKMISRLLDAGCTVVFPEPAHMGHDWSIFSAKPLARPMQDSLGRAPKDCRCFVVPYVKARGEHRCYFERYDIDQYAEYEVK